MISPETRMMGLPCGDEIMIVGRTMWTQSTSVTDRQTDRQTDSITITDTVQRIASHGKNHITYLLTYARNALAMRSSRHAAAASSGLLHVFMLHRLDGVIKLQTHVFAVLFDRAIMSIDLFFVCLAFSVSAHVWVSYMHSF